MHQTLNYQFSNESLGVILLFYTVFTIYQRNPKFNIIIFQIFQIITSIEKDKVHGLVQQYTPKLKQLLVFDRVSEAIQIFCANSSIDEVVMQMICEILL